MPTETSMMKDSKINWIGYIPINWECIALKYLTSILTCGYASTPDYVDEGIPFLSAQNIKNGKINLEKFNFIPENLHKSLTKYKKVQKDDILQVRVGATIGNSAIVDIDLDFSIYVSLSHIRINKNANNRFINYIISSERFKENAFLDVDFAGCQGNLNVADLKDMQVPLPPIKEQQAIADFLDEKCEKIDKVIGEIEEQIQILEDYKKSLITETVTKGLDKNVPMKDSGIDWIGKIPGNWQIKKIKYLFKVINGSTPDSDYLDYWDGDITWITPADMPDFGYISKGERSITLKGYKSCGTTLVPSNSIVVSSRAPIGKINITEDTLCTNQGCKCLVSNNLCNKYYYYFLYSQKEQLVDAGRGTTFIELSTYSLSNFYALLPPIKIQEQIAGYLDKECTKIDKTINDKKEQLETIKEYKKSLIYEYVTGKKRVAC